MSLHRDSDIATAMILIGTPFFIMFTTWLAISAAKLGVITLTRLGIDCHRLHGTRTSPVNYIVASVMVLPLVLGFHLAFLDMLFQDSLSMDAMSVGAISLSVTAALYISWFRKWQYRSCY
jgi:hypothetical protein